MNQPPQFEERAGADAAPDESTSTESAEHADRSQHREQAPRVLSTRWGGLGLSFAQVILFLVVGQVVPGLVIGVWLVVRAGGSLPPASVEEQLIPYLPAMLIAGVVAAWLMLGLHHKLGWLAAPPERKVGLRGAVGWIVGLIVVSLVGQECIAWIQAQLGIQAQEQEIIVQAVETGGLPFLLSAAICAPLAEEVVFRRLMFSTLARTNGRVLAYLLSSLAFALIHFNFGALLLYVWTGVCITVAYERTGSVWGAILVHAGANSVILFWLANS